MRYLKTYENSKQLVKLKDRINWDLINDAKDMALEYLDEKYSLIVEIIIPVPSRNWGDRTFLYTFIFDHDGDTKRGSLDSIIKEDIVISYLIAIIRIHPPEMHLHISDDELNSINKKIMTDGKIMQEELISRLSEAYPNEIIIDK